MSDRKARYKTSYVDEFGQEIGRDRGGGSSSSYREPSRHRERPEIPRSESHRADAPTRSSTATTTHSVGSSRHGNRDRARKDSDAFSTQLQSGPEYGDRSQPIAIRHGDSKRYHDAGGFSRSREESTIDPGDSYDAPESSNARRGSHSTYSPPPLRERGFGSSPDHLSGSLARLTMSDVVGSPSFVVTSSHQGTSGDYDNAGPTQRQMSPPENLNEDFRVGSFRDKGKSIARDPSPAPPLEGIPKHLIRGTRGDTEDLDSSYAKRSQDYKKFFRPGRVFSTLWTESYDDSPQSEHDQFRSKVTYQVSYKQKVFSKIRRFVVVRQADRSCTCLPVTTYDGRGYKKKGINLDDHGLIYSSRDPPLNIRGITKQPLRIILSKGAEKLGNPSYLNYGRVYTVETNVKVKDVGDLDTESRRLLRTYYREVHFRDFPDDDNYAQPGPSSNPQQRDVEVAGAGAAFASTAGQQKYGSRGQYDQSSSGRYNQQPSWTNATGFPPPASSMYPAAPIYPQPQPTVSGNIPAYQYANVPTFDMNRGSSAYQSDFQYNQDVSSAGGFANQQILAGPQSQMYPQAPDPRWPREQPSQPQYQTIQAPLVSGSFYGGRDQGYNDQYSVNDSRYLPPDPNYGQSQGTDQAAGWTPASTGRQVIHEEDVTLPTLEQAQATQRQRRQSSTRYSTSSRGGYDESRDRYRSSGSGHRGP
ncbi:hypothetical protein ONS96_011714 [Cadophora gregata f. sp. sojae]|nr:hypothetical protein ONS96_011714 [Cadophora gregata f. sp. sojae]